MRILRQFLLILLMAFLGEVCHWLVPLPIPSSIYGLLFLLFSLLSGLVRVEQVRETARFLIEIMPVMFIPAAVGLLDSWEALSGIFVQTAIVIVASTVLVMAVSGRVTQWMIQRGGRTK